MTLSWNSTSTAIASIAGIVIYGIQAGTDLANLAIVIAPLGAYIVARERSRINSNNGN